MQGAEGINAHADHQPQHDKQQKAAAGPDSDSSLSEFVYSVGSVLQRAQPPLTPHVVMGLQSLVGNYQTRRMIARQAATAAPTTVTFGGLMRMPSPAIQRRPPANVGEAIQISTRAAAEYPSTKPKQSEDVFSSLRADAREAVVELTQLAEDIATATGGSAEHRKDVKSMNRSWEKKEKDYKGDSAGLIDLIGSKIVYQDFRALYGALDFILNNDSIHVAYFKDRFLEPVKSGYSDIIMSVLLSGGHIGELRLHLASVDAIFEKEHRLYEIVRSKGEDALTDEQKKEYAQLQGDYARAREAAFASLGSG